MGAKLIWSIAFVVAGISALITILVGSLWLREEIQNQQQTSCTITNCQVTVSTCSQSHTGTNSNGNSYTYYTYYTCYIVSIQFEAVIDGTDYYNGDSTTYSYANSAYDYCSQHPISSAITCYYDASNPSSTLSDSQGDYYGGAIATVVVFGVIAIIALIVGIVVIIKC